LKKEKQKTQKENSNYLNKIKHTRNEKSKEKVEKTKVENVKDSSKEIKGQNSKESNKQKDRERKAVKGLELEEKELVKVKEETLKNENEIRKENRNSKSSEKASSKLNFIKDDIRKSSKKELEKTSLNNEKFLYSQREDKEEKQPEQQNQLVIDYNNKILSNFYIDNENDKSTSDYSILQDAYYLYQKNINVRNFFENKPNYDLSVRLINDEQNKMQRDKTKEFKFFDKINQNHGSSVKILQFNLKKFLKLDEKSFFNILTFSYDNIDQIKSVYRSINEKITITLNNKYSKLIYEFRDLLKDELELQEYYFERKEAKKNSRNSNIN